MEEKIYRVYVTDVLKMAAEKDMLHTLQISSRYIDLLEKPIENEKTGDEIALDVINRAGLKGKINESV